MKKVMYIVMNEDLGMSAGKVGAQAAHASFDYLLRMRDELEDEYGTFADFVDGFKYNGDRIVILKAHEEKLLKWEKEGYTTIRDYGLTEIPGNSITAVCLGIYDKDEGIPKWIQRLRLL